MDVWTWAAIALFLGPVLAGLAVPILRWLFHDLRRVLLLAVVLGLSACYWKSQQPPEAQPRPLPKAGASRR